MEILWIVLTSTKTWKNMGIKVQILCQRIKKFFCNKSKGTLLRCSMVKWHIFENFKNSQFTLAKINVIIIIIEL